MSVPRDAVVVGGGPAGAHLAGRLARAGRDVLLLERTTGPHHKVCGEFLSHEAIFYVRKAGLDPVAMGGVDVSTLALIRRDVISLAPLPFPALSLSRHTLDEALIGLAGQAGAEVRRGCRVRGFRRQGDLWHVEGEGLDVRARDIFLATGKHDLRDRKRPPGRQPNLIGFKQRFRLPPGRTEGIAGRVELYLMPHAYCGLELVEGGLLNVSLLVDRGHFATLDGWEGLWTEMVAYSPVFARRTKGAVPCLPRPLAISAIPYGHVRSRSPEGVWHLGDQAAVIPSFAGNGISMALHSADLAADHHLGGHSAGAFQAAFARDVRRQIGRATLLSRLLISPLSQPAVAACAGLLPNLMPVIARATRLPARVFA